MNPTTTTASPTADLLAGTPYRFLAPLTRGGMADIVLAEQTVLGKQVVVKLLQACLANSPHLIDRMRLEAQALGRLTHPNLVVVTDFGQTSKGRPYLVMERLVGRTLREEQMGRGTLPVLEAIEYTRQTLAGLGAAHAAGIVHRDVKLENLFLCDPVPGGRGGRVIKVLDFGIAKILAGADAHGLAPAPLAIPTAEGMSVGTPRFFSPEQALSHAVDERTDIYAAGIVLYSLLAGRAPFDHWQDAVDLAVAHVQEAPAPLSQHAPQAIPEALENAVMRALAKRPEYRFPSARAFAEELARIAASVGSSGPWLATEPLTGIEEEEGACSASIGDASSRSPSTVPTQPLGRAIPDEDAYRPPSPAAAVLVVMLSGLLFAALAVVAVLGWMR